MAPTPSTSHSNSVIGPGGKETYLCRGRQGMRRWPHTKGYSLEVCQKMGTKACAFAVKVCFGEKKTCHWDTIPCFSTISGKGYFICPVAQTGWIYQGQGYPVAKHWGKVKVVNCMSEADSNLWPAGSESLSSVPPHNYSYKRWATELIYINKASSIAKDFEDKLLGGIVDQQKLHSFEFESAQSVCKRIIGGLSVVLGTQMSFTHQWAQAIAGPVLLSKSIAWHWRFGMVVFERIDVKRRVNGFIYTHQILEGKAEKHRRNVFMLWCAIRKRTDLLYRLGNWRKVNIWLQRKIGQALIVIRNYHILLLHYWIIFNIICYNKEGRIQWN